MVLKLLKEIGFWGVAQQWEMILFSIVQTRGTMIKRALLSFIFITSLFSAESIRSSVIRTENGFIDYANRIIVCRGTSDITQKKTIEGDLEVIEKNLKLSKGEARLIARTNLLELIKLVNFDGRTVGELMLNDQLIGTRVQSLVASAYQQGEIEYLERNQVVVALAVKMSGLAEILIDVEGYMSENLAHSTYLMTRAVVPSSEKITGVVIDTRNIYHIPAMVPRVYNEDFKLVYGPRHYTRSRSVNRGPIGYAHSMEDDNINRRVGNKPLVVEAVSSDDNVNLTITNLDGDRIRDAENKFGILSNCRVLVLLK